MDRLGGVAGGDVKAGTDIAEHLRLVVDGLVGSSSAQPSGTIRGQRQQRQVPVRCLEDGGMEIGHGRTGRRHDRHGGLTAARTQTAGQAEGEESGITLVDAHMRADEPRLGERSQSIDQGSGP